MGCDCMKTQGKQICLPFFSSHQVSSVNFSVQILSSENQQDHSSCRRRVTANVPHYKGPIKTQEISDFYHDWHTGLQVLHCTALDV